jgi:uncharacterized protein (DUF302 family)
MVSLAGMKLFAVIDQSAEAHAAGMRLRDRILVVFGSPAAGTPGMVSQLLTALDLPLKAVVWADSGRAKVSYNDPASLAARHHFSPDPANDLAGIDALTKTSAFFRPGLS